MAHIRQNRDNFYFSFQNFSKSEDEIENLIECCARYFQGAVYNSDSVDVCIAAIVKTLGVNLNLFQKDPKIKLMTLTNMTVMNTSLLSIYSCIIILAPNKGNTWMHFTTVMLTCNITSKMLLLFLQGWSRP